MADKKSLIDWDCVETTKSSQPAPAPHAGNTPMGGMGGFAPPPAAFKTADAVERKPPNTARQEARAQVGTVASNVDIARQKIASNNALTPTERQAIDGKLRTMSGECKKIDNMITEGGT